MVSRNYRRQINNSLAKQNATLERSESGLRFSKLSDDVAAGSRAMHIQEERYQTNQQLENVKDLLAEQKSIDSNLSSMHSILQTIQERVLTGMSEDWGDTAREVIAKEIGEKREQLLQFANAQFGGHTLFGGTNNSTPPFTVSDEGKLLFNGIEVEGIWKDTSDGKYYYNKPVVDEKLGTQYSIAGQPAVAGSFFSKDGETFTDAAGAVAFKTNGNGGYESFTYNGTVYTDDGLGNGTYTPALASGNVLMTTDGGKTFTEVDNTGTPVTGGATVSFSAPRMETTAEVVPNSGDTFADIGLGLKISGDQRADPRTAYQVSFSGLTIMGNAGDDNPNLNPIVGANGTQVSGNLYDLLGQIQEALSEPMDKKALDDMYTQLVALTDDVGMVRTDLGNRMEYLQLTQTRLTDDITNMTALETDLISSDPAEEAIKMKECEYVWLALMQLGSKVLPASLLDFMH